jgi:hypothetical protein
MRVMSPAADDLNRLFGTLHIDVSAERAEAPGLEALIDTDGGLVRLSSAPGTTAWSLLG